MVRARRFQNAESSDTMCVLEVFGWNLQNRGKRSALSAILCKIHGSDDLCWVIMLLNRACLESCAGLVFGMGSCGLSKPCEKAAGQICWNNEQRRLQHSELKPMRRKAPKKYKGMPFLTVVVVSHSLSISWTHSQQYCALPSKQKNSMPPFFSYHQDSGFLFLSIIFIVNVCT